MLSDFITNATRTAVGHVAPPSWYTHGGLRYLQAGLYKQPTVLLCMDGIANVLDAQCVAFDQQVFALDLQRGQVFPAILGCINGDPQRRTIRLGSAAHVVLPRFDVFVSGCHGCSADGYAYSPCPRLKSMYMDLQQGCMITKNTRRIVAASPDMLLDKYDQHHPACFMRAHGRLDATGFYRFRWEDSTRRPRPSRRRTTRRARHNRY